MLLIVESPSKCTKIESFLPCQCISSKGHLRELKVLPKPGEDPVFEIIDEKKTHIESMRKVIKKYSSNDIYLATDDDREGEAIAWHICQVFGLPVDKVKRIIFHEVTKAALEKAVSTPGLVNMALVRAQQARQVLDLTVGFRVSPVLWKYLYRNREKSLSAGRCQTPALRLVYDNHREEKEITQTYKVGGLFFPKKVGFELSKELDSQSSVLAFLEASKGFPYEFLKDKTCKKDVVEGPPRPYHTSGLLQAASSLLRMSPKEVMSGCQQLYQDGHITYMRTESQQFCAEYLGEVRGFITGGFGASYVGDLDRLENRDSGNPHEAIRVTHLEVRRVEGSTARIGKLYELIWRNSVASCMSTYRGEQTSMFITSPLHNIYYVHKVDVPLFMGWKVLESSVDVVKEQTAGAALILYMKSQKEVTCQRVSAEVAIHGKKTHYTEASLIKRLEDVGIGRPSTFASLVETLMDRGYVKKGDIEGNTLSVFEYVLEGSILQEKAVEKKVGGEKGKLVIQPVGIVVAEFLTEHFGSLFAYDYTRGMELDLDKIAANMGSKDICKECNDEIERLIQPVEKRRFVIKDSSDMVVFGRYGLMIQSIGSKASRSVREGVDMGRLARGEYTLDELVEKKELREIGEYLGSVVTMARGPFGWYVGYKDVKMGCKTLLAESHGFTEGDGLTEGDASADGSHDAAENKKRYSKKTTVEEEPIEEEVFNAFVTYMETKDKPKEGVAGMIRDLTPDLSIRNGKYGAYIFYKTPAMKKPKFFALKGFKESYRFCQKDVLMEWIRTTHQIQGI
jgi:DNA topoisomerase-1